MLCGPRSGRTTDEQRVLHATTIGLGVWLAVVIGVLSLAFVPHATYFGVIALPLAAFAVHGAARALDAHRRPRAQSGLVLPVLVVVQGAWDASIIAQTATQLRPLAAVVLLLGVAGGVVLARARSGRRLRVTALWFALLAALLGPVVWSSFVLGSGGGGSASDAFAGPRIGASGAVPMVGIGSGSALIHLHRPFSRMSDPVLTPAQRRLVRYVDARNRHGAIAFAGDSLPIVVSVVLGTDASPLPMGGFSRQAPQPDPATLRSLIRTRRLRFVLLLDSSAAPENATVGADRAWVRSRCLAVLSGRFRDGSRQLQTLYDCGDDGARRSPPHR